MSVSYIHNIVCFGLSNDLQIYFAAFSAIHIVGDQCKRNWWSGCDDKNITYTDGIIWQYYKNWKGYMNQNIILLFSLYWQYSGTYPEREKLRQLSKTQLILQNKWLVLILLLTKCCLMNLINSTVNFLAFLLHFKLLWAVFLLVMHQSSSAQHQLF